MTDFSGLTYKGLSGIFSVIGSKKEILLMNTRRLVAAIYYYDYTSVIEG